MISLTTQKEAGKVRDLTFCYWCGNMFEEGVSKNYDHVPPKSIFDKSDRSFPLKLAIHEKQCHRPMSQDDEVLGQLVALIHGKQPSEENDKLKIDIYQRLDNANIMASFSQRNLEYLLRRWLRGFHAALYGEPLDSKARFAIQTPFPSGRIRDDNFVEDPIMDQYFEFVNCIKRNRAVNNLDRIVCNNGKLRFECVWDRLSDNSWACIFALDLYEGKNLGDVNNFQARGCAGLYCPPNGKAPTNASLATQLEFSQENIDRFDPFAV